MKKKNLMISRLVLQKNVIATLNQTQSDVAKGGATEVNWDSRGTCGPCNASLDGGCPTRQYSVCYTINNAQGVCCGVINTGINGPC